jgi:hypothetical protein
MKALVTLSLLQLGLLLFLFLRISTLENELHSQGSPEYGNSTKRKSYEARPSTSESTGDYASLVHELRTIVRQELSAQLAALPAVAATAPTAVAPDSIDETEYQYQLQSVMQKMDLYESVGNISQSDMHNLQSEIMTLNAADRKQALSRLARAMNSGAVKGQL